VTGRRQGSVRVVRTFRVTLDGQLLAVTPAGADPARPADAAGYAWTEGQNDAGCRRADHTGPVPGQTAPAASTASPATVSFAARSPTARTTWLPWSPCPDGSSPARRGVRAQHAQIQALWLSDRVETDLAARIAARYPSVALFHSRQAMLAEFPPTRLPGYRLRRGPSRLLLVLHMLLAAVWIVATAASSAQPHPAPAGATGAVLLLAASAGAGLVVVLRRSWRYWAGSLVLPAVLLAAGFIVPGRTGEILLGAAVLGNLAGVATEVCLFAVTYRRLGRRLCVLDPHHRAPSPWGSRPDTRCAGIRLLALYTADLLTASAARVGPAGARLIVLGAGAALLVALTAVLARRERHRQHRLGLGSVAAGLLLGTLAGALTSPAPTASSQATSTAAMLLIVTGTAMYWLQPTSG